MIFNPRVCPFWGVKGKLELLTKAASFGGIQTLNCLHGGQLLNPLLSYFALFFFFRILAIVFAISFLESNPHVQGLGVSQEVE